MRHHSFDGSGNDSGDEESGAGMQVVIEGKTDQDRYIEMSEINLGQRGTNQNTLDIALRMLEKSWTWWFRSPKKKMELVSEYYGHLTEMI